LGDSPGVLLARRVQAEIARVADAERKRAMEQYLRNQFTCLGAAAPAQKQAWRRVYEGGGVGPKDLSMKDVRDAALAGYRVEYREMHYWASTLLCARHDAVDLEFVHGLITRNSWWDTVDLLACNAVGPIVMRDRTAGTKAMRDWLKSDDMWVRRSSILHQLKFREKTDVALLLDSCEALAAEEDFFIRKAIGWALRGYARTDGVKVIDFCNMMGDRLSPLSRKEALKHADKPGRNFNMQPTSST